MAKKRFRDIEIWDKEWYMDLRPRLKCLVDYLYDNCDASGVWKPNWRLLNLRVNDEIPLTMDDILKLPKDNFEVLENGKIFIVEFINFQYGTLSEASPAHKPVFQAIKNNNLTDRVFNRLSNSLKDKYKEKDKEEDKETSVRKKDFVNIADWQNCHLYQYEELNEEFKKMYSEETWERWKYFNSHIDNNCPNIRKIDEQIKIHEYGFLKRDFIDTKKMNTEQFLKTLDKFDNHKGVENKYNSVYKALKGWLDNELNWAK